MNSAHPDYKANTKNEQAAATENDVPAYATTATAEPQPATIIDLYERCQQRELFLSFCTKPHRRNGKKFFTVMSNDDQHDNHSTTTLTTTAIPEQTPRPRPMVLSATKMDESRGRLQFIAMHCNYPVQSNCQLQLSNNCKCQLQLSSPQQL